jgi:hypothetical protein
MASMKSDNARILYIISSAYAPYIFIKGLSNVLFLAVCKII